MHDGNEPKVTSPKAPAGASSKGTSHGAPGSGNRVLKAYGAVQRHAGAASGGASQGSPGKGNRVLKAYGTVQRHAGAGAPDDTGFVSEAAATGVAQGGAQVPYKADMEAAFGISLDHVSAHTGEAAAAASRAIGAEAYTTGSQIAFQDANPSRELVAHELTHVIQQQAGAGPAGGVGQAGDRFEREADAAAASVSRGGKADVAQRYDSAGAAGALQRKAVQRYESSEHAQLGDGMAYPYNLQEMRLPNGAMATRGELVAFGDFYADMTQLERAPRQETEALIGLIRFEGIWQLARRQKRNAGIGGSATTDPTRTDRATQGTPESSQLETMAPVEGGGALTWNDAAWDHSPGGMGSLRQRALEIHSQFTPAWEFFAISIPLEHFPSLTVASMKATLGRRRFRETNQPLQRPGGGFDPDNAAAQDGGQGGDFFDLAANNVSHFAVSNWATWEEHHRRCTQAVADHPGDSDVLNRAIIEDSMGAHYLTDQFAAGHMVDKEELMTFATNMMVTMSQTQGRSQPGDDRHTVLEDMLVEALQQCFDHDDVYNAWCHGAQLAHDQGLIDRGEMELLTDIPRGNYWSTGITVVGNIVNTIMGMPWRNVQGQAAPIDGTERSRGPQNQARGQGDYHLGVGNLAALQVHEAINHIGFTAYNQAGISWRMQGDGHLTAATQQVAQAAVDESTRQVRAGTFAPQQVKQHTPTRATIEPQWVRDYYQGGGRGSAMFHPDRLRELLALVAQAQSTPIDLLNAAGTSVSPLMRDICHKIMEVEFTAHPSDQDASDSGTGINVSMLSEFLVERLPDMVPAAYANSSASDLPSAALEAYVPRDASGNALPTAANNFRWSGDTVSFKLNVSGCAPGPYTIGIRVHDLDSGHDRFESGQEMQSQMPVDTDSAVSSFAHVVTVPSNPAAASNGRSYLDVNYTITGAGAGDSESYVVIYADRSYSMVIGRSSSQGENTETNRAPTAAAPRVTGADADQVTFFRASGIDGDAFQWSGNTVMFRVRHNAPPSAPAQTPVRVWIRQFDKDAGYDYNTSGQEVIGARDDDEPIGSTRRVQVGRDGSVSQPILFQAHDDEGDTYIVVYADPECTVALGRSNVQGENRGTLRGTHNPASAATDATGFSWSGATLSFAVTPATAQRVWIKFFNEDWGNDYDSEGRLLPGARNEDSQVGGIHPVAVRSGRASITATGDADNSGDTYAIVFADASCNHPIGRSELQP